MPFTSHDYTGYFVNINSDKLELVMDLESDRMESLSISKANLDSERDVVKEERRFRVDNNISGFIQEKLFASTYKSHSYKWPIIGSMVHLSKVTVRQCKDFFKQYYAPNNAVLVIAGSFKKKAVKKLVDKYYSHIPPQKIKRRVLLSEREQKAQRKLWYKKEVGNPKLSMAFLTTKAGEKDFLLFRRTFTYFRRGRV